MYLNVGLALPAHVLHCAEKVLAHVLKCATNVLAHVLHCAENVLAGTCAEMCYKCAGGHMC